LGVWVLLKFLLSKGFLGYTQTWALYWEPRSEVKFVSAAFLGEKKGRQELNKYGGCVQWREFEKKKMAVLFHTILRIYSK
jgi:hypothetical protein